MRTLLFITTLALSQACSMTTEVADLRTDVITSVNGLQVRMLETESLSMHYNIGGHGEDTVLLVHGFGANGMMGWGSQIKALVKNHRVIIPDLLWFGDSESSQTPSLHAQSVALLALLDKEGVDSVHIIGISYGGFVTMDLTMFAPERIKSAIIIDSPGPEFGAQGIVDICQKYGVDKPEDIFVPETPAGVQRLMDIAIHRTIPPFPEAALRDLHTEVFSRHAVPQRKLIQELAQMTPAQAPNLDAWHSPTLVIWGEYDPIFPVSAGAALAKQLNAEFLVIPDTAHTPNQEKPRPVNKAISAFLAQHPPSATTR